MLDEGDGTNDSKFFALVDTLNSPFSILYSVTKELRIES